MDTIYRSSELLVHWFEHFNLHNFICCLPCLHILIWEKKYLEGTVQMVPPLGFWSNSLTKSSLLLYQWSWFMCELWTIRLTWSARKFMFILYGHIQQELLHKLKMHCAMKLLARAMPIDAGSTSIFYANPGLYWLVHGQHGGIWLALHEYVPCQNGTNIF